jgi:Tol biopolymer transport system component
MNADGTGATQITFDTHFSGYPSWSPDGGQIVFSLQAEQDGPWSIFLVNADGKNLRPLHTDGMHFGPQWSPDGKSVAFEHWTRAANGTDWVAHPIGIVDVATGQLHDVGPVSEDGYVGWGWSPDGTSILEVPKQNVGTVLVVNAATGHTTTLPWSTDGAISWQRVAP